MYEYKAKLIRVIDGDTFEFNVDCGFGVSFVEKFRLLGCDTPEVYGKNASEEGRVASAIVKRLFNWNGPEFIIGTAKDKKGKYGRYLVDLDIEFNENGEKIEKISLSDYLISNGYARIM